MARSRASPLVTPLGAGSSVVTSTLETALEEPLKLGTDADSTVGAGGMDPYATIGAFFRV